ncbi:hypothetical protein BU24DRAFT_174550 [Aaosphaeria arxii CBS 175.79]|uniref:Secreted protein n=1 Tax=Aaosphaeria arxii CBS 175.79 TaxID=1450172 RepID=A0A6A5XPT4_9PLEO|nr:uncharacterized protein BU24DRAFT_174550 [Aaosphaeria arxii CBS 175.79]KAF2015258.1 hypothetical protein BU24DRAFT_174550 [Aaosphaeria arxii CBS 175.79]
MGGVGFTTFSLQLLVLFCSADGRIESGTLDLIRNNTIKQDPKFKQPIGRIFLYWRARTIMENQTTPYFLTARDITMEKEDSIIGASTHRAEEKTKRARHEYDRRKPSFFDFVVHVRSGTWTQREIEGNYVKTCHHQNGFPHRTTIFALPDLPPTPLPFFSLPLCRDRRRIQSIGLFCVQTGGRRGGRGCSRPV